MFLLVVAAPSGSNSHAIGPKAVMRRLGVAPCPRAGAGGTSPAHSQGPEGSDRSIPSLMSLGSRWPSGAVGPERFSLCRIHYFQYPESDLAVEPRSRHEVHLWINWMAAGIF